MHAQQTLHVFQLLANLNPLREHRFRLEVCRPEPVVRRLRDFLLEMHQESASETGQRQQPTVRSEELLVAHFAQAEVFERRASGERVDGRPMPRGE